MLNELKLALLPLRGLPPDDAERIARMAFRSLTIQEQVTFELAMQAEEDERAREVASALRRELAKYQIVPGKPLQVKRTRCVRHGSK